MWWLKVLYMLQTGRTPLLASGCEEAQLLSSRWHQRFLWRSFEHVATILF
jgi:hypothetical protein